MLGKETGLRRIFGQTHRKVNGRGLIAAVKKVGQKLLSEMGQYRELTVSHSEVGVVYGTGATE